MRRACTGVPRPDVVERNRLRRGTTVSDETRAKMSVSQRARIAAAKTSSATLDDEKSQE